MSQVRRQPEGDSAVEVLASEIGRLRRQVAELERGVRVRGRFEPVGAREAASAALDDATSRAVRLTHFTELASNTGGPISVDLEGGGARAWRVVGLLKSSVGNSDTPWDLQLGLGANLFAGARIEQGTGSGAWLITNEIVNDRILIREILHDSTTVTRFTHLDVTVRYLSLGSRTSVTGELIQTNSNANSKWVRFSALTVGSFIPTSLVLATQASADFAAGNRLASYVLPFEGSLL